MKHLITLFILLFCSLCFSQNTGSIGGKLLDKEYANEPLLFAHVSIKGTAIEATTDSDGAFVFENLTKGSYTLVCSFVGYETQELTVQVLSGKMTEVNAPLAASTISLNELIVASLNAEKSQTTETLN